MDNFLINELDETVVTQDIEEFVGNMTPFIAIEYSIKKWQWIVDNIWNNEDGGYSYMTSEMFSVLPQLEKFPYECGLCELQRQMYNVSFLQFEGFTNFCNGCPAAPEICGVPDSIYSKFSDSETKKNAIEILNALKKLREKYNFDLNCMQCGKDFKGQEPQTCCSGRECGCMGMPTEPIVCSKECYELLMKNAK